MRPPLLRAGTRPCGSGTFRRLPSGRGGRSGGPAGLCRGKAAAAMEEPQPSQGLVGFSKGGGITSQRAQLAVCNGVRKFVGMLREAEEGTGVAAKAGQTLAQRCVAERTSPRDGQNGHPSTPAISPEERTGFPPSIKHDRACKPQQRKALERS